MTVTRRRGRQPARRLSGRRRRTRRRLFIGSHLDTVPHAGAFDGVLGVMLGIALVDRSAAAGCRSPSRSSASRKKRACASACRSSAAGRWSARSTTRCSARRDADGRTVREAIRAFGLESVARGRGHGRSPARSATSSSTSSRDRCSTRAALPLGVVDAIAGQTPAELTFTGAANHAGTTPMALRRDALAGAAEWITAVERAAATTPGWSPRSAGSRRRPAPPTSIAGRCVASLDVRHADDRCARAGHVDRLRLAAREIAARRGPRASRTSTHLDQPATPMDAALTAPARRGRSNRSGAPIAHA